MSKHTALFVAIFATAALALGWHARGLRGATHEIAATVRKLEHLRVGREKVGRSVALLAVISVAVLYVVASRHM